MKAQATNKQSQHIAPIRQWMTYLGGCTKQVYSRDKLQVLGIIMALNTCEAHQGVHHFAVIGEGHTVVMSDTGVECLRAQGVRIDSYDD